MAVDYDMNSSVLIDDFNRRDNHAFEYIFLHLYDALYRFSSKLYVGTEVVPDDVVQDVFMNVLKSRISFESLEHLKAYLYLSVKNSYRRYWVSSATCGELCAAYQALERGRDGVGGCDF